MMSLGRFKRAAINLHPEEDKSIKSTSKIEKAVDFSEEVQHLVAQSAHVCEINQEIVELLLKPNKLKKMSVYGVSLYDEKGERRKLTKKQLLYLSGCFMCLNWEVVSPFSVEKYLETYRHPSVVDRIRFENYKVKFDKKDQSLEYNIAKYSSKIVPLKHELSTFLNSHYVPSINKLTRAGHTYRFRQLIQQVESNQNIFAVRTANLVYVITPQKTVCFKKKCFNMKWSMTKLYLLCIDKKIRVIHRQLINSNKINEIWLQQEPIADCNSEKSAVCVNQHLVLVDILEGSLIIKVLGQLPVEFTHPELKRGDINCVEGFACDEQLAVVVVMADYGEPSRILDFRFRLALN